MWVMVWVRFDFAAVFQTGTRVSLGVLVSCVSEWHWGRYIMSIGAVKPSWMLWVNELHYSHDDVIRWKHFPRYWPFVRGIHRSPVNSPHNGQCRGALMLPVICAWINGWVNNREAGDLRRHRGHYDFTVMKSHLFLNSQYKQTPKSKQK